jgi:hypothetical protein
MAGVYTARIVDQTGTPIVADLADISVGELSWVLNEVGTGSVSFPKDSISAPSVDLLDNELQVFRDGSIVWWGPMTMGSTEGSAADVQLSVPELSWYFTRRQISDDRPNALTNPSFEGSPDLTGWTATGPTATADTTRKVLGSKSAKLVQASAGADSYLEQSVAVTGTAVGTLYTLAAWVYVSSTGYLGPAFQSRGLFVSGVESGTLRAYTAAEIDDATPQDQWVRLETTIWVPPLESWTLYVRLYAPGGTVFWDAAQLVRMESAAFYEDDIGVIAGDLVTFVQTAPWDDLNITTSDATTGIVVDRAYQHADHLDFMQALGEFVDMGLDWKMAITSTTRVFTTGYPLGTDRIGTVTLSMRSPSNPTGLLSDYRYTVDGAATSTRVVVLGEGDGPDREEGYAADTSSLGGLLLGEVVQARPGTPIDGLQAAAEERLSQSKQLVEVLEVTGLPSDSTLISTVVVGDRVTVDISDGWVSLSGAWRVVAKRLDPASDTPSLTLNRWF